MIVSTTLEEKVNAIADALDQLLYEIALSDALPDDLKMNVQDIERSFHEDMAGRFDPSELFPGTLDALDKLTIKD